MGIVAVFYRNIELVAHCGRARILLIEEPDYWTFQFVYIDIFFFCVFEKCFDFSDLFDFLVFLIIILLYIIQFIL